MSENISYRLKVFKSPDRRNEHGSIKIRACGIADALAVGRRHMNDHPEIWKRFFQDSEDPRFELNEIEHGDPGHRLAFGPFAPVFPEFNRCDHCGHWVPDDAVLCDDCWNDQLEEDIKVADILV